MMKMTVGIMLALVASAGAAMATITSYECELYHRSTGTSYMYLTDAAHPTGYYAAIELYQFTQNDNFEPPPYTTPPGWAHGFWQVAMAIGIDTGLDTPGLGGTELEHQAVGATVQGTGKITVEYLNEAKTSWRVKWYWNGALKRTEDIATSGPAVWAKFRLGLGNSDRLLTTDIVADGATSSYPWDSAAELGEWELLTAVAATVTGGYVTPVAGGGGVTYRWPFGAGHATLQAFPPHLGQGPGKPVWVYRGGAALTEAVGLGAATTIVNSGVSDPTAWMLPTGRRFVAYQAGGSLYYVSYNGSWSSPVLIRASRSKPRAFRLTPGNDTFIPCLDASGNLKLTPLRWNGATSSYTVGAEIDVGVTASEVGDMWMTDQGRVCLTYVDTSGDLQMLTGDARGTVWV